MKGISRSFAPFTISTLVSPVSNKPSTSPSFVPLSSTTSRPTRSTQYSDPSSASPSASRGTATSEPRSASALSRSSQPASFATGPFECTSKSSSATSRQPSRDCNSHLGNVPSVSADSVNTFTFTQPLTPKAPTTRPITTRGDSAGATLLGGGLFLLAAGDLGL